MADNKSFDPNQYSGEYSEKNLFDKVLNVAKKAGIKVIYAALVLFYTLQKPTLPGWAKATIIGALGYFISPLDAILDVVPIAGYTDDLGVLLVALAAVAMFIDDDVKQKAKNKLSDWFGDFGKDELESINEKIRISKNRDSQNKKCAACGATNEKNARFCNACGTNLDRDHES